MKQFSGGLRRLVRAAAQLIRPRPELARGGAPGALAPVYVAEPLTASSGRADPSICRAGPRRRLLPRVWLLAEHLRDPEAAAC